MKRHGWRRREPSNVEEAANYLYVAYLTVNGLIGKAPHWNWLIREEQQHWIDRVERNLRGDET